MIAPEIIEDFIEQTDQQLQILDRLDRTYSDLLSTTSSIREESNNTPLKEVITILVNWIYTISARIRRKIEEFEIHREHLVRWYYNGLLGSEDW